MHVLNTTRKVVAFITRNIKNPQFLFLYSLYFFQKEFRVRVSFFSNDEVIALVTSGKSLLRLGDGEIGLLNDRGIIGTVFLQKSLPVLKQGIYRIITGYTKNSPYVIALPKKYASYSNEELRMEGKLRSWLPFKVM